MKHVVSLGSLLWVTLNLLVGLALLLPVALARAVLPFGRLRAWCDIATGHIYRAAVRINGFWMKKVVGINITLRGDPHIPDNAIILCNHQSWFDIAVIQEVVASRGPMVRFLVKSELIWVPVIGWICLALKLPRLQRSKRGDTRQSDRAIILQATEEHDLLPGALLIFAEGTRFGEAKRLAQGSPYRKLLKPKRGGFSLIAASMEPDTSVVDLTINYHRQGVRIWECLHGDPRNITVCVEHFRLSEIDDAGAWLEQRWRAKDALLEH